MAGEFLQESFGRRVSVGSLARVWRECGASVTRVWRTLARSGVGCAHVFKGFGAISASEVGDALGAGWVLVEDPVRGEVEHAAVERDLGSGIGWGRWEGCARVWVRFYECEVKLNMRP